MTIPATDITMKAISGGLLTQPDSVPNPFGWASKTNQPLNQVVISDPEVIEGMDSFAQSTITVDIGRYSVNFAAFTSAPGLITDQDSIRLENPGSGVNDDPTVQTCNIEGIIGTFTSTTIAVQPPTGNFTHNEIDVDSLGHPNGTFWDNNEILPIAFNDFRVHIGKNEISGVHAYSGSQSLQINIIENYGTRQGLMLGAGLGPADATPTVYYQYKTFLSPGFHWDGGNAGNGYPGHTKWMGRYNGNGGSNRTWIGVQGASAGGNAYFSTEAEGPDNVKWNLNSRVTNYVQPGVWQIWTEEWQWRSVTGPIGVGPPAIPNAPRFRMWGAGGTALGPTGTLIVDTWEDEPVRASRPWPTWGYQNVESASIFTRFISSWNGGPTQDQTIWMDDYYITDATNPLAFDLNGIPEIISLNGSNF